MHEPDVVIDRITALDDALVAAVNRQFLELAWERAHAARFVGDPDNLLLIARRGDHVCGVLWGHRLPRLDRRAEVLLYSIDVHAHDRRQGIGRRLVEATKRWAAEVDAAEVWVLTNRSNGPAMALYAATGGEEDAPNDTAMFIYSIASPIDSGATGSP